MNAPFLAYPLFREYWDCKAWIFYKDWVASAKAAGLH